MTQFLQLVKGYRPVEAGIAFLPTTIPNFVAAMRGCVKWADRVYNLKRIPEHVNTAFQHAMRRNSRMPSAARSRPWSIGSRRITCPVQRSHR